MPAGTPRQLSSIVTLPRKFVYSVLSVAVFFSVPWIFRAPGMPAFVPWLCLGALTFNALAAWKIEVPLKRVRLDDTNLYSSNFVVETVEPLTNVAEVRWGARRTGDHAHRAPDQARSHPVIAVHRRLDPLAQPHLAGFGRAAHDGGQRFLLGGGERRQHEVDQLLSAHRRVGGCDAHA